MLSHLSMAVGFRLCLENPTILQKSIKSSGITIGSGAVNLADATTCHVVCPSHSLSDPFWAATATHLQDLLPPPPGVTLLTRSS